MPPAPGATTRACLRVKPVTPQFTDSVLADLSAIRRTATGRGLFKRLHDTGRMITIEKPAPPTRPPNAWTRLRDPHDHAGTEILIVYDPADWPDAPGLGPQPSDVVLFGRLLDAVSMAEVREASDATEDAASPAVAAYLRDRARGGGGRA